VWQSLYNNEEIPLFSAFGGSIVMTGEGVLEKSIIFARVREEGNLFFVC